MLELVVVVLMFVVFLLVLLFFIPLPCLPTSTRMHTTIYFHVYVIHVSEDRVIKKKKKKLNSSGKNKRRRKKKEKTGTYTVPRPRVRTLCSHFYHTTSTRDENGLD